MTTMSSNAGTRTSTRLRAGLAISALVGVAGAVPTPSNGDGPPFAFVVLGVILTIVVIASAALAWRSGNRLAIRTNAAALLLIALTTLPVLFVHIAAWVKVGGAAVIVLAVVALVLTLRPEHQPFTVTD
jgi:hypothetical protein